MCLYSSTNNSNWVNNEKWIIKQLDYEPCGMDPVKCIKNIKPSCRVIMEGKIRQKYILNTITNQLKPDSSYSNLQA